MSSPGDVAAVLGEVDRRAEIRRAVQAVDEAVDDGPREQLEVADPREDLRIDEPRAGHLAVSSLVVRQALGLCPTCPTSASPPPTAARR